MMRTTKLQVMINGRTERQLPRRVTTSGSPVARPA
jgi:hypothetical protein